MLDINTIRLIKPIGSVDDYESGELIDTEDAKIILLNIMGLIKDKYMSITQISKATGQSRPAIARRIGTQLKKGNVVVDERRVKGAQRLTGFYKVAAQC